ncbi:hypothetical protein [Azospirillum sp.]|uniref:hypothetical protein n=1 Tax=Azospirillum sp. TaxID=34012 RepID=UPI002D2466B6|nr:hypothetical protein [Azospirillum sp.]HYF88241.1 hypothetical protein [Azospirillum sp.]
MGINIRFSDAKSELMEHITISREEHERSLRDQIRAGKMSMLDYLMQYKGFRKEHAEKLIPSFEKVIFRV